MIQPRDFHTPVLLSQTVESLRVERGKKYIDATLGGGGYAIEIEKRGGIVIGIDRDRDAIDYVRGKIEDGKWKAEENKNLYLVHGNFKDLKEIAHSHGFEKVYGIIFDLGMSSYQLDRSGRGFSYQKDENLDMRMDTTAGITAADILNNSTKEELYEIFTKYAEELHSRAIAEAIVRARPLKKIGKTAELVKLIEGVLDRKSQNSGNFRLYQDTKSRIFQALRIVVNKELENLERGLTQGIQILTKNGRIAVISYHSLEDRIVKLKFIKAQDQSELKILTKVPARASYNEIEVNARARSAKLRVAEKIT